MATGASQYSSPAINFVPTYELGSYLQTRRRFQHLADWILPSHTSALAIRAEEGLLHLQPQTSKGQSKPQPIVQARDAEFYHRQVPGARPPSSNFAKTYLANHYPDAYPQLSGWRSPSYFRPSQLLSQTIRVECGEAPPSRTRLMGKQVEKTDLAKGMSRLPQSREARNPAVVKDPKTPLPQSSGMMKLPSGDSLKTPLPRKPGMTNLAQNLENRLPQSHGMVNLAEHSNNRLPRKPGTTNLVEYSGNLQPRSPAMKSLPTPLPNQSLLDAPIEDYTSPLDQVVSQSSKTKDAVSQLLLDTENQPDENNASLQTPEKSTYLDDLLELDDIPQPPQIPKRPHLASRKSWDFEDEEDQEDKEDTTVEDGKKEQIDTANASTTKEAVPGNVSSASKDGALADPQGLTIDSSGPPIGPQHNRPTMEWLKKNGVPQLSKYAMDGRRECVESFHVPDTDARNPVLEEWLRRYRYAKIRPLLNISMIVTNGSASSDYSSDGSGSDSDMLKARDDGGISKPARPPAYALASSIGKAAKKVQAGPVNKQAMSFYQAPLVPVRNTPMKGIEDSSTSTMIIDWCKDVAAKATGQIDSKPVSHHSETQESNIWGEVEPTSLRDSKDTLIPLSSPVQTPLAQVTTPVYTNELDGKNSSTRPPLPLSDDHSMLIEALPSEKSPAVLERNIEEPTSNHVGDAFTSEPARVHSATRTASSASTSSGDTIEAMQNSRPLPSTLPPPMPSLTQWIDKLRSRSSLSITETGDAVPAAQEQVASDVSKSSLGTAGKQPAPVTIHKPGDKSLPTRPGGAAPSSQNSQHLRTQYRIQAVDEYLKARAVDDYLWENQVMPKDDPSKEGKRNEEPFRFNPEAEAFKKSNAATIAIESTVPRANGSLAGDKGPDTTAAPSVGNSSATSRTEAVKVQLPSHNEVRATVQPKIAWAQSAAPVELVNGEEPLLIEF